MMEKRLQYINDFISHIICERKSHEIRRVPYL